MKTKQIKYIYGPVPSRRLGLSLGIDLVPLKTCTYDCIYCQLGHTTNKTIEQKEYVSVSEIINELKNHLSNFPSPEYITLAGSGEPTLNSGIGEIISEIKSITNIPVAVITNGSLLWVKDVRNRLLYADVILPSLDAGDEYLFHYVNRPHPKITFQRMVEGLIEFRNIYKNQYWLEVFLLGGVTGILSEVRKIASLVKKINPDKVHLNSVFRPPIEEYAYKVSMNQMMNFPRLFDNKAEIVCEYDNRIERQIRANASEDDIISLLSRRPCTLKDISEGLCLNIIETTKIIQKLIECKKVSALRKDKKVFYVNKR